MRGRTHGSGGGNGWEDRKGRIRRQPCRKVGMLDLGAKQCGRCGCDSLVSPPRRVEAEPRLPLAEHSPAPLRRVSRERMAGAAGRRGCPSSKQGPGGEGRLVT